MARQTFKIEGLRELERELAEFPKATARNILVRAGTEAIEPLRQAMADNAPYDPNDRDGDGKHLNETMVTRVAKAGQARRLGLARAQGVLLMTGPAPVGQRARANAGWQEEGTVEMTPNPYARPAADSEGVPTIRRVKDALTGQIDKAKARIARKLAKGR